MAYTTSTTKLNNTSNGSADIDAIASKVAGSRFEDIVKNNPYANFAYKNGIWDKLGDTFGFRTNQDQVREQMAMDFNLYNAQALQNASEEEYNSEAAQVARQRAAGINPDLNGVAPGSATEFDMEQPATDFANNSNAEIGKNIVGNIISLATGCLNIASQWQGLSGQKIQNDIAETALQGNLESRAREFVLSQFGPDDTPMSLDKYGVDWLDNVISLAGSKLALPGVHAGYRKRFQNTVRRIATDLKTYAEIYKGQNDMASFRRSYLEKKGSAYYSPNDAETRAYVNEKTPDEIMAHNLEPLIGYLDMTLMNQLEANSWRSQNDRDEQYFLASGKTLEHEANAREYNAENAEDEAKARKEMNTPIRQVIHNLSDSAKKGDLASLIMLIKLYDMYSGNTLKHEADNATGAVGNVIGKMIK